MHKKSDMHSRSAAWRRFTICFVLGMVLAGASFASEGSASVYPAGVETIMAGQDNWTGQTMLVEFTNFL